MLGIIGRLVREIVRIGFIPLSTCNNCQKFRISKKRGLAKISSYFVSQLKQNHTIIKKNNA